jgi:RNA polymerase sigma-70 factor (sigma-E family)
VKQVDRNDASTVTGGTICRIGVPVSDARFDDLFAEHGAGLLRVAYLLCRDRGRAEDLVQDALIKALRQSRRGQWPDQLGPYLRKVVLNEYLGWRRRRSSREIVGVTGPDRGRPDHTAEVDDRAVMWQLLGTLTPRARAVLVLRYYEDLPDRDIAQILDCAPPTVRTIAARALTALREHPDLEQRATGLPSEKEI